MNHKKLFKKDFLDGIRGLYEEIGEAAPSYIFDEPDFKYTKQVVELGLKELVAEGKIVIMKDPYRTGKDYIGLANVKYPKTIQELLLFREKVEYVGLEEAKKLLNE